MNIKRRDIVKIGNQPVVIVCPVCQEKFKVDIGLVKLIKQKIPFKAAYRLGRLYEGIIQGVKYFNKEQRKLVEKHGEPWIDIEKYKEVEKDEVTGEEIEVEKERSVTKGMRVKAECNEEFQKEMEALLDEEVALWYNPMSLDELGDVKIEPIDMIPLFPFFKDIEPIEGIDGVEDISEEAGGKKA